MIAPTPPATPPARARLRRLAAWAGVYLVAAFARLAPLSLHPFTRLGDEGDALLAVWVTWWGTHHLSLGWPGILEANAFHPHPAGLLYAEPLLTQVLVAWPLFRWLDPVPALNLLTVATFALCALGFHLYAREWGCDDSAAAVGAVVYAFNAYMLSNAPRIQLVSLGWLPLALLALHRLFMRGQARWAVPLALFSLLHGLSCLYYLTFYLIALLVLVPVYLWITRAWRRPALLAALAAALAVSGAGFGLVALPYARLFHHYGFVGEVKPFDLLLYLTPPSGDLLYGGLGDRLRPAGFYVDFFLGYVALALAGVGAIDVARPRTRARALWLAWLALAVAALALSAGRDARWGGRSIGTGPFALVQGIEPFSRIREPRRLAVLVFAALGLFAARGAAALLGPLSRPKRAAVACALAAVVALEQWSPRTEGAPIPVGGDVPDVYRWLAARPGAEPIADLPPRPATLQRFMVLDQYFSTVHGKPIMTGWPSFFPPALELLNWDLRDFPDARSLAALRALGFRLAVVHPKRWEGDRDYFEKRLAAREDVLPTLARFPDRARPTWDRYGLGGEEVHEVSEGAETRAPRECACREIDRRLYQVEASTGSPAALAVDGRARTRWTTVVPQGQGMWFEVVLDHPRPLARVEIEMAYPYGEFARNLEIIGRRGAEDWPMGPLADIGYEVRLLRQLVSDPQAARLRYDLRPATVDRLRLLISRTDEGAAPWSIPEIHVFETTDAPDGG